MGESLDPGAGRPVPSAPRVRVFHGHSDQMPEAAPDIGAEAAPPPAHGLPERFGEAAGDTGFRPVPEAPRVVPPATPEPPSTGRTSLFDTRIQGIIAKEGNYSNDPKDRGGATKWGITEATARAFGYTGDMRVMSRDHAISIYRARYWQQPGFDRIETIDPAIAIKLLDWGITSGPTVGVKALQRALNSLNREAAAYPDVAVDGVAGAVTMQALRSFVAARGREGRLVLLGMLAAQQSVFYMAIAETRPANERFEYGWQLNRALAGIA